MSPPSRWSTARPRSSPRGIGNCSSPNEIEKERHLSYVDVNGLHMYYETEGEGRPLVLLHGGLGSSGMFGPVRTALAKGHRVIAPDLQAHGRTADIDRPIDPKTMAGDIIALVEHLRLGKTDLMGYSLGSAVALHVAIQRPDLVRRVVAVSTVIRRLAFYPEILQAQT